MNDELITNLVSVKFSSEALSSKYVLVFNSLGYLSFTENGSSRFPVINSLSALFNSWGWEKLHLFLSFSASTTSATIANHYIYFS